jgi:hypothetical protein
MLQPLEGQHLVLPGKAPLLINFQLVNQEKMKSIRTITMAISLIVICQFAAAQNCQQGKILMSKGWKGACGCHCQKQCVNQNEVQAYINLGWYIGECTNIGRLCCGGWLQNPETADKSQTTLTDVHPDHISKAVSISFNLSKQSEVNLQVFDVTGRYVATVANKVFKENSHDVTWNASGVNPGIYFLKMNTADYNVTRKIAVTN